MGEDAARRCLEMARYLASTGDTVRGTARRFGVSKSLVHRELTVRLERLDRALYQRVRGQLQYHKAIRHLLGGEATKRRYLSEKQEKWGIDEQDKQK